LRKRCVRQFKRLNPWLQFYLLLFPLLLLSDYLRFLTHEEHRLPAWLIFGITAALWMSLRRRQPDADFGIPRDSHIDLLFWMIILFLTMLRTPMPDNFWDTLNYHVSHQSIYFRDQLHFDFFSCGFMNSFFFPLGDSFFSIFRELLGYRLGTLGNVFVLGVSYYSLKQLLNLIAARFDWHIRAWVAAAFAAMALLSEYILANIGTYAVDLLALPVFLALLILFVAEKNPQEILLVSGLALLVVLKLVNLFLVVPLVVYSLHHAWRRRRFAWKESLLGAAFGLPFLIPYLLFPYLQTGNPFFPFFNKWFGSPYFAAMNFFDTRWGPKGLVDFLAWPIRLLSNHQACEFHIYHGRLSWAYVLALLACGLTLVQTRRRHSPRTRIVFCFSAAYILLIWLWQGGALGYIRYGLSLEALAVVLLFVVYQQFSREPASRSPNASGRKKGWLLLLFFPVAFQVGTSLWQIGILGLGWPRTYSLASLLESSTVRKMYFQDVKRMGRDRRALPPNSLPSLDCWISLGETGAWETLLAPGVPMVRPLQEAQLATPRTRELYRTRIEALRGREVYIATPASRIQVVMDKLLQFGFVPGKRQIFASPLMHSRDQLILLKLTPLQEMK
jgi:hypothetical protein